MTHLVYLDTETTGLDPDRHHIWEIAYAINDGPIESAFVPHSIVGASETALEVGGYYRRISFRVSDQFERGLATDLEGATIVGANPAFDAAFLRARWGFAPWNYRLLDIETYAAAVLGYRTPPSLKTIQEELVKRGFKIPAPDHTAAGDVATLRACHKALTDRADRPTRRYTISDLFDR